MEYYELSPDGEWTGPHFRWSPTGPNDNKANVEIHGFFLDDLALDPHETCYVNMCEDNPCAKGQTCESTWDGKNAGYTCHGGKCSLKYQLFVITIMAMTGENTCVVIPPILFLLYNGIAASKWYFDIICIYSFKKTNNVFETHFWKRFPPQRRLLYYLLYLLLSYGRKNMLEFSENAKDYATQSM